MSLLHDVRPQLLRLAQDESLSQEQYNQVSECISPALSLETKLSWLQRLLVMLAGMCLGLGLIFWVAANWDNFSLMNKFILAEGGLAASLVLGCFQTRARQGLLLLAVLALGGLLALYAQEYSTNSGPWRLFAMWALLALPIVLVAKHQVVWLFWWLLVLIASSLWLEQNVVFWSEREGTSEFYVLSLLLLTLAASFYPKGILRTWLGNSPHHLFRWAISSTLIFLILGAWGSFFWDVKSWPLFTIFYLAILGGVVYALHHLKAIDKVILATASLGLNAILVGSWFRCFIDSRFDSLGALTLITLVGAGLSTFLLVICVKQIKRLSSEGAFIEGASESAALNQKPLTLDNADGEAL